VLEGRGNYNNKPVIKRGKREMATERDGERFEVLLFHKILAIPNKVKT